MTRDLRQLKLGAFIMATGHYVAAWRHPDADANAGHSIDHYRRLAETAERGLFDLVFVADSPAGWDGDRDPEIRARVSHSAHFEPVTLWSALSQVTEHVGFVATASTTYEDPYLLARKFLSLGDWPSWLSGGQRQRVALARALISRPDFLALDEPLGALDALTRITMQRLVERVWVEQGFTALFVTHDVAEAAALADRVVVLDEGRVVLDIDVPRPRPRERGTPELARLEGQLLKAIFAS